MDSISTQLNLSKCLINIIKKNVFIVKTEDIPI